MQWEYQVGPSIGIDAGDHIWASRYILEVMFFPLLNLKTKGKIEQHFIVFLNLYELCIIHLS